MINTLTLGNKVFPVNIIQGPLAGVSCAPFRLLTWRWSKPAFSCTEMISCKTLIYQTQLSYQRYIMKDPSEGPVCFQLSASDPGELAEATRMVSDFGADLIDLNCGCPVKKIRGKGAGSSLLMDPLKLSKLITAMKQNTSVPVSIKIRVEGGTQEKFNNEIAKVVRESGTDFLVVHGRHWTQHYETPCNYDEIQFFVEELKIPVIGNGDISCVDSLKKMYATGCAGVMISRAGVGQPWLIDHLIKKMRGEECAVPSVTERGLIFIEHLQGLMRLLGSEKHAILQARKFAKYYARGLWRAEKFCERVNFCEDFKSFEKYCLLYFS